MFGLAVGTFATVISEGEAPAALISAGSDAMLMMANNLSDISEDEIYESKFT